MRDSRERGLAPEALWQRRLHLRAFARWRDDTARARQVAASSSTTRGVPRRAYAPPSTLGPRVAPTENETYLSPHVRRILARSATLNDIVARCVT